MTKPKETTIDEAASSTLSPAARFVRRHAQAQAVRPAADHNGHVVGPPATYVYDDAGKLVKIITEDQ